MPRAKRSKYQPITLYTRRIVSDGRGHLKCEVCGRDYMMKAKNSTEYEAIKRYNAEVIDFYEAHIPCLGD